MMLDQVIKMAVNPALALLPMSLDSVKARVLMLAIGLQESRFIYRQQVGGPARSYWQFETGGVKGVYTHHTTNALVHDVCNARQVGFNVPAIFAAMSTDDVLGAAMCRMLLFTDPAPLPEINDEARAWAYYVRNWGPGKPRVETWADNHTQARIALGV